MKPHLFILLSFMGARAAVWGMIGLRGLLTRKPFVVSFRLRIAAWAILMGHLFFMFLYLSGGGSKTPGAVVGDAAVLVFWTILVIFISPVLWSGLSVYGATDASFRAGLLVSLTKLNLTYEENSTGLRLPTIKKDLVLTAPGTMWKAGSVDMKQRDYQGVLRDIAKGMNEYYRSEAVIEVKSECFWLRALLAVLLAVITGLIFSWRVGRL